MQIVQMVPNRAKHRAYFRKIKRSGIGRFLKKRPFWKNVFLHLNQKCQKQIRIRGYLIFTCAYWLPKCPFVKQSSLFIEVKNLLPRIFLLNSFILNKYILNFSYFSFEMFLSYISYVCFTTHEAYILKIWTLIVKTIN